MRKVQAPFQLDPADIKLLDKKAEQTQRSKSNLVRALIRKHLDKI